MSGTSTNFTQTPNLGLFKPVYAADAGYWGTHLNANADKLDGLFGAGGTLPYVPLAGGTMTGKLTLSGNATANLQPVTLQQQNTALGAYLPTAGGQMSGPVTPITTSNGHAVSENFPSLDFRGGNIAFYRNITNATGNEVGANPKVFIQLDNACANYTVQPWGGYDGPTAFFVNATNHAGANGSVVATWSQITSQGNNNYTAQDTAHYVRVIRTGQNSCWGIAIQHQDNTGMPAQPFSTMGIENAMQINGPDDPRSYYNATYSLRQGMSFIPSVNPTNTWTANTQFSTGIIVTGTPSGGVLTCYVAQNTGRTGATQPTWPASGNVTDGTITWKTGTIAACELGVAILVGGGRPQLPNTAINIGIGFNSPINGACIDTTLAVMNNPNAAAIRLAEGQIIDFTGGGSLANQNRRWLGYSDFLHGMEMNTPGGAASLWTDDGGFTAPNYVRFAGNNNNQGVTTGYSDQHLTICRNIAGLGAINFVTADCNFITFYNTNGSGTIGPSWLTLGATNSTFASNVTVGNSQPNYIKIAGGAAGSAATITTGGPTADLDISPALNGRLHYGLYANFPTTGGHTEAMRADYILGGTVTGSGWCAETHSVNSDNINGNTTWFNFAGNISAGAVGGRVGYGINMVQNGATTCPPGQFYVASANWITGNYSAGGTAGNTMGSLFASNDLVKLQTGAGLYWEEIIGYELDISVQAGTGCSYKRGMKIITGSDDAVSGHAGHDYAYSLGAQSGAIGWDVAYAIGDAYGVWPMKTTGTLIGTVPGSGGPAYAAAWGIDFSTVTFSGGLIKGNNFSVDGSGSVVTLAGGTFATLTTTAGGIGFNNQLGSGPTDVSRHVNLYGGIYGIGVTGNRVNMNVPAGAGTYFVANGIDVGSVTATATTASTALQTGGTSGPTWTTGAGAPAATAPAGSLYSRTAGATGTRLYVSAGGGTWNPVAGV